ncbi:MAG: DnaJ domain-containing protein [Rhodospirillales bacterium]|nr:DnaJ domain-containing protein [Rhodospirillales bacterium]
MSQTNHYATFGLESDCTDAQIRSAYRILAKQHHPDRNGGAAEAHKFTQALNAAYEVLGDPDKRRRYDRLLQQETRQLRRSSGRSAPVIEQELHVRIDDLLRGTTLTLQISDPGNPQGREDYELVIPPGTAPNSRLRVERTAHPGAASSASS